LIKKFRFVRKLIQKCFAMISFHVGTKQKMLLLLKLNTLYISVLDHSIESQEAGRFGDTFPPSACMDDEAIDRR